MKVIVFQGGLGNQLFQYCSYCKLKEDGFKVKALNGVGNSHNGFEIDKYFDVNIDFCSPLMSTLYSLLMKRGWLKRTLISEEERTVYYSSKLFFKAYWQDKEYMPKHNCVSFKQLSLSDTNLFILDSIQGTDSVSIHIRRGDYLLPANKEIFGNICTRDYYNKAIQIIQNCLDNPRFYIFSNDSDWVKNNLCLDNAIYVDWNQGEDSIYDMFLMSKCKANIIANSSFSYWAAKISGNKTVIYPQKWWNHRTAPDIFDDGWIA